MEFDLAQLQRQWIRGVSSHDFLALIKERSIHIEVLSAQERLRGVLIAETDPIAFTASFFASVDLKVPVILANPNWGGKEWEELSILVDPALSFGVSGRPSQEKYDYPYLKSGTILIPTGGTTGGVRLAIHNWTSLSASVSGLQVFLGGGAIHCACQLPLYHVSGLMQILRSLQTGGCIHFDENVYEGDCLSLVPTQLQRAMECAEGIHNLKIARAVFIGGSFIPESVASQAQALRLPVIPVYGLTETAAMVAAVPNEEFLKDFHAGAVPLGEAHFSIMDGRIQIQAPSLFQGYQGSELINSSEGYLTGDMGGIDPAGRLHIYGRADCLINTGGEKVDPREVEAALLKIKGIEAATVYGEPDLDWGEAVVARIISSQEIDFEMVRAELKIQLSNYKVPRRFVMVE